MAHAYLSLFLFIGLLSVPVRAQTIFQGGIAGGDFSRQASQMTLPADLLYFTAELLPGGNTLARWATAHEADVAYYAVEVSADGRYFREVARHPAANAPGEHTYRLTLPGSGPAYHRLRITEADGREEYSEVVRTTVASGSWDFRPLSNPQRGASPQLITTGLFGGKSVSVRVVDTAGRIRHQGNYSASGQPITLPVDLPPATYAVTLSVDGLPSRTQRMVVVW